ncbi:MAG: proprotein convertase P-domain-containing protein, partial [Phycisphaerales bacterium JB065]
ADTGALVEDVTVSIDLTHGWIGDLTITVSHAGESVVLVERVGSASWTFGCGGDDINAVFTDDASIVADALCTPEGPTPMLFGGILPAEALSVFSGTPVEGDWIVTVVDASAIDAGVINSVCVSVVAAPGECVGDVTGDHSVDLADLNLVLANFGQVTSDGDADGSGEVDLADLNIILANFGATC